MDEVLPPITASLSGILIVDSGESQPDEDDYRAYLEQKHGGKLFSQHDGTQQDQTVDSTRREQ